MCAPELLHAVKDTTDGNFRPDTSPAEKQNSNSDPKSNVKQKLTPDEIKEKLQATLERLNDTTDYVSEQSIADFLYLNKRFSSITRSEDRTINMHCLKFGIVDLCLKVWKFFFENSDFLDPKDTVTWNVMKRVLVILWNGTDRYVEICQRIIEVDAHRYCLEIIQNPKIVGKGEEEPTDRQIYTIKGFFGVLHNILASLGEPARMAFRDLGAVEALRGQLNNPNTMVKTKAYINLAYLINEDENDLINADDTNIKHIVEILASAVKSKNRFSKRFGFSAMETIEALNKLAVNDSNKEKILSAGALAFYEDLLLGDTAESDKEEILRGLWIISFSPKCREAIINMPDIVTCKFILPFMEE